MIFQDYTKHKEFPTLTMLGERLQDMGFVREDLLAIEEAMTGLCRACFDGTQNTCYCWE